jgi:hypothetical protein
VSISEAWEGVMQCLLAPMASEIYRHVSNAAFDS